MATELQHGSYTDKSRFSIIQHGYMGGENGFREVLEVNDPERGQKFVIHEMTIGRDGPRHNFSEWKTLKNAKAAFGIYPRHDEAGCSKRDGFIRIVSGYYIPNVKPWFYAGPGDLIEGDWVALVICDGCNVRGSFEHRCHGTKPGSRIQVAGEWVNKPCQCAECIELAEIESGVSR